MLRFLRILCLFSLFLPLGACSSGAANTAPGSVLDDGGITSGFGGTWDVQAMRNGQTSAARIELSGSRFLFSDGTSTTLEINFDQNSLSGLYTQAGSEDFQGTESPSTFSSGGLLLPFGGAWTLTGPGSSENCKTSLTGGSLTASCTNVTLPAGSQLPRVRNKSVIGTRTAPKASSFGDFGGTWTLTESGASCTVNFEGNKIDWSCAKRNNGKEGELGGTMSLTFSGNTLSGSTSSGVELSGVRQ